MLAPHVPAPHPYPAVDTGGSVLTYDPVWRFPNASAPSNTITASAVDLLVYNVRSATTIDAVLLKGFGRT